jgi:hypothetical protein
MAKIANETSTESKIDRVINSAKEVFSTPGRAIGGITGPVADAINSGLSAAKLVLAETGVWRQVFTNRGSQRTGKPTPEELRNQVAKSRFDRSTLNRPIFTSEELDRTEPTTDYYIAFDEYLMPVGFDISIQGSKLISRSQLVDGPTIFERIANEPTSVNISFKLESKPNSVDMLNPYKLSSDVVINKEIGYGIAAELAELFRQIKAEDRVFEIENPILNDKFNIFNVVLESYSVTPERGSTIWEVSLDLLEVNTDYALLYVENSDGAQAEPPTAKTNV